MVFNVVFGVSNGGCCDCLELSPYASTWDRLGYIPVVSTVTGLIRVVAGVFKAIICSVIAFVCFIAGQGGSARIYGYHALNGLKHFGRGLVEMIPLVNMSLIFYDKNKGVC